ncbi:alpha/beta hydrolase [Pedobacter sp. BS3]|nr:alpha/beta hydrolase [Pedobacter sp. BS3]
MVTRDFVISGANNRPVSMDITIPAETNVKNLVLFAHGFKGFKDWGTHNMVARYFASRELPFLKFNFSHNGTTPQQLCDFADLEAFGENTFSKELYDINCVIDFCLSGEEFARPEQLFLIGHSVGGGISIIQAAEDKRISKLVTWASVNNFNTILKNINAHLWRSNGVVYVENSRTGQQMPLGIDLLEDLEANEDRLSISRAAAAVKCPWLIIHGDADETVPLAAAFDLHLDRKNNLVIIPRGNHTFGASHPYTEATLPTLLKNVCDKTIAFLKL